MFDILFFILLMLGIGVGFLVKWYIGLSLCSLIFLKAYANMVYDRPIIIHKGFSRPFIQPFLLLFDFNPLKALNKTITWYRTIVIYDVPKDYNDKYLIRLGGISINYHMKNSIRFAYAPTEDNRIAIYAYLHDGGLIKSYRMCTIFLNKSYIYRIVYNKAEKKATLTVTSPAGVIELANIALYLPSSGNLFYTYSLGLYTDDKYKATDDYHYSVTKLY